MKVIEEFTYTVREIEHCLIPLSDGTQLAARIWLPQTETVQAFPAVLEYLPYRKRDGTAVRDALTHPWMAGQGYVCVRVDMRGNGESEGLMADEYLLQEQNDALQVIDWLCQQPWCDGNVGMMGISWGGFNSLQVAARQPEALKAIITLCSTDDRFADDIHYKGGNLLLENFGWAATMLNFSAAVPDPLLVGDGWREQWLERLNAMPLLAKTWLEHQTRDGYWRHGSVCEDYSAIKAAVYAVGGWGDAYKNSVPRMMQHLQSPTKSMIGPWIHKYPHFAVPNPAIGFLQEARRWWDYWLKGIDNGVMDGPTSCFYLQDALPPRGSYAERPGHWVQTNGWPDEQIQWVDYSLGVSGLGKGCAVLQDSLSVCSPLTTGLHQGEYCAIWFGPDGPTDQRRDDANSLCFDSPILSETLEILGDVRLNLRLASNTAGGQLVARLNAVAPDGQVSQITYGVLNLNLRDDPGTLTPPVPGEPMQVRLNLDHVGYRLPAGYRLRISLSTASFPLIWPSRELTTLTLLPELQGVQIPVFTGQHVDCPFEEPQSSKPAALETIRKAQPKRSLNEDVGSGEVCVHIQDDLGAMRFLDHGLWVDQKCSEQYRILPWDPSSARADIQWFYRAGRDEWGVEVDSRLSICADEQWFYVSAEQVARENGKEVHRRTWEERVARVAL